MIDRGSIQSQALSLEERRNGGKNAKSIENRMDGSIIRVRICSYCGRGSLRNPEG